MKGSLRQVVVLMLVAALGVLAVGSAGAATAKKPCKPKTAKKCKKHVAPKPKPAPAPRPTTPPAPTPVVTLAMGPGMPEPQATWIRTSVDIAKGYLTKLGAPSNWKAAVYVEPSFDAIVADYAKVAGSDSFARTQCANGCAFAGQQTNIFILPFGSSYPRPDEQAQHMKVPVHELWHTVQYALDPKMFSNGGDGLFQDGPTWLREGSAEFVGYTALQGAAVDVSPLMSNWLYDLRNRYAGTTLQSMASGQGNGAAYSLGFFATELLVKDVGGMHALVDYWAKLGQGAAWPAAFQQAFGRTVDQFYAEFAAYRQSL